MSSISVTSQGLQALQGQMDQVGQKSTLDQENTSAVLPIAEQEGSAEEAGKGEVGTLFSKYGYDEFIGPGGYDRLDRITQLILSAANARTWRNADKFVAPGNDCYAGAYRVADIIKPGVRKVEMDFKSLHTLDLIDIYPDYRLVKQKATGKVEMTACIIKDFRKLYALAHEYYLWEQSPAYIPPEWRYKELILADEALTAKLRRFDNYRRILECHKPGRKPGQAEPPLTHADLQAIAAEDAQEQVSSTDPKRFLNTQNKTFSSNRDTKIPQRELAQNGFSRSGYAAKLEGKEAATAIGNECPTNPNGISNNDQRTLSKSNTNTPSGLEETRGAAQAGGAEKPKSKRKKHAKGEVPPPLPDRLLDVHLRPISFYFCDQAPASSKTSFAWLFAEFSQRGFDDCCEEFAGLVNDARDETEKAMREGRIHKRNKDGTVAQMPYFFSILETSVYAWCKWYDEVMEDQRNESTQAPQHEEVAALSDAIEEHDATHDENLEPAEVREPALPLTNVEELEVLPSQEEDQPPASMLLEQETELSSNRTETTFSSPDEQQPAPQENNEEWWPVPIPDGVGIQHPDQEIVGFIDTTDPDEGWRHGTTALKAGQLHSYLGQAHYQYTILPTRSNPERRYGIVIVERGTGRKKVYVRDWEIERSMQQHLRL